MSSKKVTRLYQQFQPENYQLTLRPDREAMSFTGSVVISGQKAGRPSQRITLHQKDLTISSAEIIRHDKKGDQTVAVSRINHQRTFDEVRLHTDTMLYPGRYTVKVEFNGTITRPMNGIYPCFFTHEGQEKMLIATQFESHHAREAFPCVDEPEAKATFDLTLHTPDGETVIANTPVKHQQPAGDSVITTFETSPKMSTYLVAFAFGELAYREATTSDGTLVRTYATPENVAYTEFALDVAVKTLEFYNDYFGIKYPLAKCDMIALPDFASGAMENWGLITYREQTMLVDPDNTSLPAKQHVAMVVGHELAHQWFGNLVTMRWWTDLWLNEGFASWIEYMAVDHVFPEWDMWTQFIGDEQQPALKLDALENTHPIEVPVNHPDEIRSIFDTISYSKGASVIHMLHHYLGADAFRDGLRHYLRTHAYGNTDTVDLWSALEEVSKKPVKQFMHAWTSLPGFPIVSCRVDNPNIALTQERFYTNPVGKNPSDQLWPVPLLGPGKLLRELFDTPEARHVVSKESAPLKLNLGQTGFYRTIYDSEHLQKLANAVRDNTLAPLDKLGLLGDVFEATKAGHLPTVNALEFLSAYANESHAMVWDTIAGSLLSMRGVMDDEDLRESMKPYIRNLVAKELKRLAWEKKADEPYFDALLRPTILGMAAGADEPAVVAECLRRFQDMQKPEDIDPDLRGIVYGTAVRKGGEPEFEKLHAMYAATKSSEERVTIAAAVTGFEQPELYKRALSIIDTPEVRLQDAAYWIAYSFSNRFAKRETWAWLKQHWQWLEENIGSDLSFYRIPIYVARSFSDKRFIDEYDAFFTSVMSLTLERSYKQGREMIEWQAAWKERDFDAIRAYFDRYNAALQATK